MKLRIMHKPRLEMTEPFIVEVNSLEEAKKIIDLLNEYDAFQYVNLISSNDGLLNSNELEQWDENKNEWLKWYVI